MRIACRARYEKLALVTARRMDSAAVMKPIFLGGGIFAAVLACVSSAEATVVISSGATINITCTNGVCAPTHKYAVLNVASLQSMLASSNVKITTGTAGRATDIEINAGLSWASANILTLDSYHSIVVDKPVAVTGSGGMALLTNDGGSGGIFSFGPKGYVTFWSLTSPLSVNGSSYTLVGNIATLASDVASNSGGHFALAASYDASSDGTYNTSPVATSFTGFFEGLGNTISKISINEGQPTGDNIGLFATVNVGGVVENVRLAHVNIAADISSSNVGELVGTNFGTLSGDFVSGHVAGGTDSVAGGLVGDNSGGIISNSSASVSVTVEGAPGTTGNSSSGGGLVGSNGNYGSATGSIENSFASGSVRGGLSSVVGGLVGAGGSGTIVGSYATGAVSGGRSSFSGGLVGQFGAISECYATGPVNGGGASFVGGLVGGYVFSINESYATGSATGGANADVGGLVGDDFTENGYPGTIAQSYSTGAVAGGTGSVVGGLIGFDHTPSGSITNAYWDTTSSGIAGSSQGAGNISNDTGITGVTTTQLQAGLPLGFSSSIWGENADINGGLPYLLAIPPA